VIKDNVIDIYDPPGSTPSAGAGVGIAVRDCINKPEISGNRIYVNGRVGASFKAIQVQSGDGGDDVTDPMISDNTIIWGPNAVVSSGTPRAIHLNRPAAGGEIINPVLQDNVIDGFNTALLCEGAGGAVTGQVLWRPKMLRGVTTEISNTNSSTVSALIAGTYTPADATPSVQGIERLTIANAGAVTITALDDGLDGQTVLIDFADANTTFDFSGTTLKGNAGVDKTFAAGDGVRATKVGSNWLCDVIDGTA
jgi:hypothetical protein